MLRAENLVAGWPGRPPVLDGVSCTVPSRLALLGPNGCGKTTLLRCLSGAHQPSSGRVLFGETALCYERRELQEHRRAVQLVLQDPDDQLFSADVTQDVSFGPLNLGLPEDEVRARVTEVLARLRLTHLAERATHHLSYGERKRVTIAGALAMRPSVLLLDEPTAGLDPSGVAELLAVLGEVSASVVIATHDVNFALAWADEVAVLADGQLTQGAAADVLARTDLLHAARLEQPWALALAARLGLPGRPRNLDEVVALLRP